MKLGFVRAGIVLLFVSLFLLSALIFAPVPANAPGTDEVNLFVTVSNAIPSIGAILCHNGSTSTSYVPTAGANKTIWCYATITDLNGWPDINQTSLNVSFYGTNSTGNCGDGCRNVADDLNNHYSAGNFSHLGVSSGTNNDSCLWFSASGNTISVNCTFEIRHFIDPGTYNVTFNVSDNASAPVYGSNTNYNWTSILYTIGNTTAINVTNRTINFGTVALGATSAQRTLHIENWGNRPFDISAAETEGTAGQLNCTSGTLDTGLTDGIRYNATTSFSFIGGEAAYRLVGSHNATGNITDWNEAYPNATGTTDTNSVKVLYWLLRFPSSGVGGSCSGVAQILATRDDTV